MVVSYWDTRRVPGSRPYRTQKTCCHQLSPKADGKRTPKEKELQPRRASWCARWIRYYTIRASCDMKRWVPRSFLWCWSWWDWFWHVFDVVLWFHVSNIGKQIPHRKVDMWEDSFHHSDIFNNHCPCLGICTQLELLLSWRFKCNSHQIGLMVCHNVRSTLILVDLPTRINIKQLFSQRNYFFTSLASRLEKGLTRCS